MKNIFTLLFFVISVFTECFAQSTSFEKTILTNVSNPVVLTDQNNQSLSVGSIYRVKLATLMTGSRTGAEYLVWCNLPDSVWNIRLVSANGIISNHPQLAVANNVVNVFTNHTSKYNIKVFVEVFATSNGTTMPTVFGSSFQWQRFVNNMYYMDGNIGIGTDSPKEKLSVNGNIRAREIKVETSNWPDYVFNQDYKLPSLSETEKFIQTNGHLPDVPKAEVVEKDGYSLNEMDKILLKKIEELTLYIIQEKKSNAEQLLKLEKEIEILKKTNKYSHEKS